MLRCTASNSNLSRESSWYINTSFLVISIEFLLLFSAHGLTALAQDLRCATDPSPLLFVDFEERDTLKPVMVWVGQWDSVNQVSNWQWDDPDFWLHVGPEAPTWYNSFFDTTWNQSWINWVKTTTRDQLHIIADTSDVYVRNRATRERFNYYSVAAVGNCFVCMNTNYANVLYPEMDSIIDFSEYDYDNDNFVDLLMVMVVWPTDGGQAHNLVDGWGMYTTDDVDSEGDTIRI